MAFFDTTWYVNSGLMPCDIGANNHASGATLTINMGLIPAGATIIVVVCEATATTTGSCADTVNTYNLVTSQVLGGASNQGILQVFRAYNIGQIVTKTLTYTQVGSGNKCSMAAFWVLGTLTASDPVDSAVTASTNGTTTSLSLASGTPAVSGEMFVCAFGANSTGTTYTQQTGLQTPPDNVTVQTTCQVAGGTLVNAGTGTFTFTPAINATVTGTAAIIIGLKPIASNGWTTVTPWKASASISAGALCRQFAVPTVGNERVFVAIVGGTAGGSEPAWTVTRGAKNTDNTVTWQECTGAAGLNGDLTNCPNWNKVKNSAVTLGQVIQNVAGTYLFICSTAGTAGNGSEPSWTLTAGVTTADNTITWTCLGAVGNFGAWAAPHARLPNALATNWGAASNVFYIADSHTETQSTGALTISPPGLQSSQNAFISADHAHACPPPALAGAYVISGSGTLNACNNNNVGAYYYGITFWAGGNGTNGPVNDANQGTDQAVQFDTCNFYCYNSQVNISFTNASDALFSNCKFATGTSGFMTLGQGNGGRIVIRGGSIGLSVYGSTSVFQSNGSANVLLEGMDLSNLNNAGNFSNISTQLKLTIKDCKLGASVGFGSTAPYCQIDVINSDSGATNYRVERHRYEGDLTTSTTLVRTGGFSVNGTPCSRQIITLTNLAWGNPFQAIPINIVNKVTGSNRNVTLYGIINAAAVPNNDQFWFDVEYLGSSTTPQGSIQSGTKSSYTASASALTADTSAWDTAATARQNSHSYSVGNVIAVASAPGQLWFCTTGGTSGGSAPSGYASAADGTSVTDGGAVFRAGCRFSLTVTLSSPQPAQAGLLTIYPKMAVASTTIIYDPLPVLS